MATPDTLCRRNRHYSGRRRFLTAAAAAIAFWISVSVSLHSSRAWSTLSAQSRSRLGACSGTRQQLCGFTTRQRQLDRLSGQRVIRTATLSPGKYRALTKIRLRKEPDVGSEPTGAAVVAGEEFEVVETTAGSAGMGFLRLAAGGWLFDQGIAGRWQGKAIVEQVEAVTATEAAHAATQVDSSAATDVEAEPVSSSPDPSPAAQAQEATPTAPDAAEPEVLEPAVALATFGVETVLLPDNMLGAGFEFVRLEASNGQQPLTFMLGSAFPSNTLTARGRALLNVEPSGEFKGGWLSAQREAAKVTLKDVRFLGTGAGIGDLPDFPVFDFPQAQLAEQLGVEVHGILGQPFFSKYDLDLDRYRAQARLFAPGQAASQGFYSSVKFFPGISLPSGNLGVALKGRVTGNEAAQAAEEQTSFVGLIDSSAAHSIINWEAAKALGFSGPLDPRLTGATKVLGAGADGQAVEMPVALVRLSICGAPEGVKPMLNQVSKDEWESTGGKGWYFEDLSGSETCVHLGAVNVAIGDPLSLSVLNDSKIGSFKGAAAIIGQDLLFQADRLVLNLQDSQMWIEPGEIKDAPEM